MSTSTTLSRSPMAPGRAIAALVAAAAALVAAFVVAPPALAGLGSDTDLSGQRRLAGTLRAEFVGYWRSGERDLPPGLRSVVDYWFRFHVIKAVAATLLLIVLVALGVRLWKAFLLAGGRANRAGLASAGTVVAMLAVFSLVVVMANVQGALEPFSSLLPMLTDGPGGGPADGDLAGVVEEIRRHLAASVNTGAPVPPAVDVLVDDFARYHAAMVVIASTVAVALVGVAVALWRRAGEQRAGEQRAGERRAGERRAGERRAGERRAGTASERRVLRSFAAVCVFVAVSAAVVVIANVGVAADPEPALLAFFEGGW